MDMLMQLLFHVACTGLWAARSSQNARGGRRSLRGVHRLAEDVRKMVRDAKRKMALFCPQDGSIWLTTSQDGLEVVRVVL